MFFYSEWDLLFILVPMIIGMLASAGVRSTFSKYSQVFSNRKITAEAAAQMILQRNGVSGVRIERTAGVLSDHFDPKTNTIRLSEGIYGSTSVAAIGVAAHEAGHAAQYAKGYVPIKLRNAIVPAVNIASHLAFPLALFGLFLEFMGLVWVGVILYMAVVLFTLITLPVELNASRRAVRMLDEYGILTAEENRASKKVLKAAAMTYVASTLAAVGSLLRLLSIANRRR